MAYEFTDDDRDKDIVTHDGTRVGTVDRVEGDRARVRRNDDDDDGLTDKVKDMLGWGDDDDDDREIRGEHVHESDDDRIRLREH